MTKTAEFGQPTASSPQPGTCRICGCSETDACVLGGLKEEKRPCGWADHTRTLCDNPECIRAAKRELGFAA